MTTTGTEFKISEEPLAERVLRQVRSGTLDESRLLPSAKKRARDVGKKLDRLASRQGWYTFMAGQAYAVATGKAPSKRNAEVMAVEQVMRWRSGVSRFAPDRLKEFDELIGGHPRRRCSGSRVASSSPLTAKSPEALLEGKEIAERLAGDVTRGLVAAVRDHPGGGRRTVRPQPVREAWSTGAEVAGTPWQTRRAVHPRARQRSR